MQDIDGRMMEFELIHPNKLRNVWETVRASLLVVMDKSAEDWIPEDIYHAIKAGDAALHLVKSGGALVGVMVTRLIRSEFTEDTHLHVWAAHNLGETDVVEVSFERLREMARACGAKMVTFGSTRKGWGRKHETLSTLYGVRP
jgi:hypothetical protein